MKPGRIPPWPPFLLGGMLLGGVAWLARAPRSPSA
jgi:hypothetical protein